MQLQSQPSASVTVYISSNDTTEGTVTPASLFFPPLLWSTAQTVIIQGVDDNVIDGNVQYAINFALSSSDPSFGGM